VLEDEVDMRLPELIPDWVLTDWLEPLEPSACSCLHSEPELAEPTLVDPELVDPELVDPELVDRGPELAGWAIPGVTWQQPSASPVPVGVTAAVRALQAAAAVVCAIDPASLSAEQAMSDAEALQDLGQQLRVHGVRRLADVTTASCTRCGAFAPQARGCATPSPTRTAPMRA